MNGKVNVNLQTLFKANENCLQNLIAEEKENDSIIALSHLLMMIG